MSSIPLPALDVKTPQQPDIMAQYGNLMRLKAMQQQMANAPLETQALQNQVQAGQLQVQQQQRALKDQQAMTAAMQGWDGKDLNALPGLVIKNGGSANAVMGLKSKILEQKQAYSKIASDDATTGAKNLQTLKDKNDMIAGQLSSLEQLPDDQLAQGVQSAAQQMQSQGLLDPQHLQIAAHIATLPPAQARQALETMKKGLMSQTQLMDNAQKQAQTNLTTTQNQAAQQNLVYGPTGPAADAKYRFLQQKIAAGQPVSAQDQNWMKGYEKQKLMVPEATAQVRENAYASSREYSAYDNKTKQTVYLTPAELNAAKVTEPGRYTAPAYTPEAIGQRDATNYFVKGKGGQQLTAFNTALNHLDLLDKLGADLGNTNLQVFNKAAQAWAQQTGNPAPTNFAAAKNAMAGEVAGALKASGATDDEINKVDQTFSRAQSPAQLSGAIATYRTLLKSKAHNLQQQYEQGMQGKPNFQPQASPSAPPVGATMKVPGSDGKLHWSDGKRDLGVAE